METEESSLPSNNKRNPGMKAKEIRELISFIAESGLHEVNIETEEFKLHIRRQNETSVRVTELPVPAPAASAPVSVQVAPALPAAPPAEATPAAPQPAAASDQYLTIKSPMIGTFYRSPNPDAGPFVNVGDKVNAGDAVCIIEAMKLFNEIESEITGKIVKVLVENASPVEYDQPLFLVDPNA